MVLPTLTVASLIKECQFRGMGEDIWERGREWNWGVGTGSAVANELLQADCQKLN